MINPSFFRISKKPGWMSIQPLERFDTKGNEELRLIMGELIATPSHVFFSCAGVESLPSSILISLNFLQQQLKISKKKVILSLASEKLEDALKKSELGKNLPLVPSLHTALEEFTTDLPDVGNIQFVRAIVNATLRTLFIQTQTSATRQPIFIKKKDVTKLLGDITGIIRVMSKTYCYAVMISFPKDTFLTVVGRMLGETYTEINAENQDAVTEILNIIYGQAKLVLNVKGAGIQPQIPSLNPGKELTTFDFGPNFEPTPITEGKTVVIPFQSDAGPFFVEVWVPPSYEETLI